MDQWTFIGNELWQIEEWYRKLIEISSNGGVYIKGKIIYANAAFEKLLGAKDPEMIIEITI